jgi:sulfite exporter TauE/SafE
MNGWLELILSAAFIAGLMGGAHCAAMCGGIAGMVCTPRMNGGAAAFDWRFALAYNGGRIASYAAAGALAGGLGQAGLLLRGGPLLQQGLLFVAGAMLLVVALGIFGNSSLARGLEAAGSLVWRRVQPHSRRFLPANTLPRVLGLGVLWGWLPCGMVYAVLLTALATADAGYGALVMLAFGLGTLPNLLGIALMAGQLRKCMALRPVRAAAALLVAGLGLFAMLKATQPAAFSGGGLLCSAVPGLDLPWR